MNGPHATAEREGVGGPDEIDGHGKTLSLPAELGPMEPLRREVDCWPFDLSDEPSFVFRVRA